MLYKSEAHLFSIPWHCLRLSLFLACFGQTIMFGHVWPCFRCVIEFRSRFCGLARDSRARPQRRSVSNVFVHPTTFPREYWPLCPCAGQTVVCDFYELYVKTTKMKNMNPTSAKASTRRRFGQTRWITACWLKILDFFKDRRFCTARSHTPTPISAWCPPSRRNLEPSRITAKKTMTRKRTIVHESFLMPENNCVQYSLKWAALGLSPARPVPFFVKCNVYSSSHVALSNRRGIL